jgi:hypothetical protein
MLLVAHRKPDRSLSCSSHSALQRQCTSPHICINYTLSTINLLSMQQCNDMYCSVAWLVRAERTGHKHTSSWKLSGPSLQTSSIFVNCKPCVWDVKQHADHITFVQHFRTIQWRKANSLPVVKYDLLLSSGSCNRICSSNKLPSQYTEVVRDKDTHGPRLVTYCPIF